jgi:phosphohistidine phosphatase
MTDDRKTILLLRHGKSDWQASYTSDHQRPLAARGIAASRTVGEWLTRVGMAPDLALTSDAVRARTTVELAADAGGWTCPIELAPEFYSAQGTDLVRALNAVDDSIEKVLLAGHEPTWSHTVAMLAGGGRVRFPTSAVACLRYYGPWRMLAAGRCEIKWLVTPKLLARDRKER